jgi:hypothetical protein
MLQREPLKFLLNKPYRINPLYLTAQLGNRETWKSLVPDASLPE